MIGRCERFVEERGQHGERRLGRRAAARNVYQAHTEETELRIQRLDKDFCVAAVAGQHAVAHDENLDGRFAIAQRGEHA